MQRGKFITFEGCEGVGKSTHVKLLVKALTAANIEFINVREPGGTPEGEEVRALFLQGDVTKWDVVSEALLMNAARRQNVIKNIQPALMRGAWVICDRFIDSTMAYQGYVKGMNKEDIVRLQQVTLGALKPDLTFILDVPDEISLERIGRRKTEADRIERTYIDIHKTLRAAFKDIAQKDPERCVIIEAGGEINSVAQTIAAAVNSRFGTKLIAARRDG